MVVVVRAVGRGRHGRGVSWPGVDVTVRTHNACAGFNAQTAQHRLNKRMTKRDVAVVSNVERSMNDDGGSCQWS